MRSRIVRIGPNRKRGAKGAYLFFCPIWPRLPTPPLDLEVLYISYPQLRHSEILSGLACWKGIHIHVRNPNLKRTAQKISRTPSVYSIRYQHCKSLRNSNKIFRDPRKNKTHESDEASWRWPTPQESSFSILNTCPINSLYSTRDASVKDVGAEAVLN
jgi:hypothetical protein